MIASTASVAFRVLTLSRDLAVFSDHVEKIVVASNDKGRSRCIYK